MSRITDQEIERFKNSDIGLTIYNLDLKNLSVEKTFHKEPVPIKEGPNGTAIPEQK